MKIMIVIEDTEQGGVTLQSYRSNADGSLPQRDANTPANLIACALEDHMQQARRRIDETGAARCWH